VEFALVLPVFLLVVFGIVQYGLYFWSMQGGSAAARDAARRGAVSDLQLCGDFRDYVKARIGATSANKDAAVITRSFEDEDGNAVAAADLEVGDVVTVMVEFKSIDLKLPFLPFIDDGLVRQKADSRVDFVPSSGPMPEVCS
jgi:Flp pilus assembly protein TadG